MNACTVKWDHDAEALAARPGLTLRFLSPLRLELPKDVAGDGDRFFDGDAFPAAFFLRRLWQRLFFLAHARYPRHQLAEMPRLPDGIGAVAPRLLWLDIPKKGAPEAAKTETTGGVVGSITLLGIPDEWFPFLVLGQYLHIGKSTRYGLGRYVVDGTTLACDPSLAPSQTLLARAASRAPLSEALAHILDDAGDLPDALLTPPVARDFDECLQCFCGVR